MTDMKKFVPFTLNFGPKTEVASGIFELAPQHRNYGDNVKEFRFESTTGAITFDAVWTGSTKAYVQIHDGQSFKTMIELPPASSFREPVVSDPVSVPMTNSVKFLIRVMGENGKAYPLEETCAVRVYPHPGFEALD